MARKEKKTSYKIFSNLAMPDKLYTQGDVLKMQILKKCSVEHPMYGEITIGQKYFDTVLSNYSSKIPEEDLPVNKEHERTEAQARFKSVYQEGNKLYADLELTKDGAENINGGHYKYFSIEIFDRYTDQSTKAKYENVLVGGAFTNYPFFRGMEKAFSDPTDQTENIYLSLNTKESMEKVKALLAKHQENKTLDFADKKDLILSFSELSETEQEEVKKDVEAVIIDKVGEVEEEKKEEEPQKHSQPEDDEEKKAMKAELETLKQEKRFSEVERKFSTFGAISKTQDFQSAVKIFSSLSDEDNEKLCKVFAQINEVVETLSKGQISQDFSDKKPEGSPKKTKDGKEIVSEDEMNKKVEEYAMAQKVDKVKAYEAIKEKYCMK